MWQEPGAGGTKAPGLCCVHGGRLRSANGRIWCVCSVPGLFLKKGLLGSWCNSAEPCESGIPPAPFALCWTGAGPCVRVTGKRHRNQVKLRDRSSLGTCSGHGVMIKVMSSAKNAFPSHWNTLAFFSENPTSPAPTVSSAP